MRKMIAMLLIVVLCVGLVACGGGAQEDKYAGEMALVGIWDNNGNKMIFKDDHTGTVSQASTGMEFEATWVYNTDGTWTITYAGVMSTTVSITEANGVFTMMWNETPYTLDSRN